MDTRKITLTLPDLVVGVQETSLFLRHGRQDEKDGSHGQLRRELYRYMSRSLEERELNFDLVLRHNKCDFTLRARRIYHHEGCVYRICYVTDDAPSVFKKGIAKGTDVAVTQLAAWAAGKYFSTTPTSCRIIYHRISEEADDADPVVQSRVLAFDLLDEGTMQKFINSRLDSIEKNLETPAEELPPCTEEERFALKSDPYSKCRTSCRVRDFCAQYAAVRKKGADDFDEAKAALADIAN